MSMKTILDLIFGCTIAVTGLALKTGTATGTGKAAQGNGNAIDSMNGVSISSQVLSQALLEQWFITPEIGRLSHETRTTR
jgi:hypothetical protein